MKEQGYTDPALEEIWAIREKIAAEFDYDIQKMAQFHMEYEKQFGDRVIPPPERKKPSAPPPEPRLGHSPQPDAAASGVETACDFDPALEEIWAIKDELSAEFDHDAEKLGRDYMEYQKRFGERLVSPPDRKKTNRPAA